MCIKVVQSKSRAVTLTLIEADTSMATGQIDDFLKNHDGAGVQHMAFSTGDIITSVRGLTDRGVELLSTPTAYYTALAGRVRPTRHTIELRGAEHLGGRGPRRPALPDLRQVCT
ncbi:VOC family protein [Salinispora arenicola]|uniref:VOC family protein n=1 Tax=Salinispora arenicola TaxID=168697 RepID=UPI0027DD5944|nr:VOC family protein [Salinispora arenicola]